MTAVHATRQNWMIQLSELKEEFDYMIVHPKEDLTVDNAVAAMNAQGLKAGWSKGWDSFRGTFRVTMHGSAIQIQRKGK